MILGLKGGEAGSNRGESFLFLVVKIAKSLRFRKKVSDQGFDFRDFRWGWSKKISLPDGRDIVKVYLVKIII
jgi:hypothetical protein